ncbi:MAG: amidohydrolase [Firmicutes bacterium]|nr:amidohydrolase [Bacillota bacterium]
MLFKNITIIDQDWNIISEGFAAVEGEKITYVGKTRPEGDFVREYDGRGKLLMSGFFNAHAHSPMTLMRGYGENLKLQDWLNTRIFPFEAHLDSNAVYWGTLLAMAESLQYGIVSTSDMYYFCDDMVRAVIDSGAKANISRSITNFTGEPAESLESFREMKDLYRDCHNAEGGRIKIDMSLHAEYTSNPQTAKALADYAKEIEDTVMHIHVSETATEHAECIARHGKTPAAYLDEAGLFDVPALAAHCVYATDEDLEIFRQRGVTVATNPISNMKLASGICDAAKVLDRGVSLAIGTDSVASNNSLDFFEEMKVLAIGNKVAQLDPEAMTPLQVLQAATTGGAKAQRRDDCGCVKAGNKADLIVVDISGPNMHPVHNIVNNLIYSCSGRSVVMTMVDGRILYENGEFQTIDIEKTIYEAEQATDSILRKL